MRVHTFGRMFKFYLCSFRHNQNVAIKIIAKIIIDAVMTYILLSYYINCGVYGGSMISVRIELIAGKFYEFRQI